MLTLKQSIDDTLKKGSETLLDVMNNLVEEQLIEVYEAINNCKGKIITIGCGTSGAAAKKIAHTLSCVECPALFLSPSDATHGALGVVQKEDIVILISKGGKTKEINDIIPSLKIKGATIIAVTEVEDSVIANAADIFLKVKVNQESDDYNMLATSSTLATIAVYDAIAIAITRFRGYSKEQFAVIHPGGEVGERLNQN